MTVKRYIVVKTGTGPDTWTIRRGPAPQTTGQAAWDRKSYTGGVDTSLVYTDFTLANDLCKALNDAVEK